MADFEYPEWNQPGIEPPQSKKDEGWSPTEKPPAEWFNWFFNRTYEALKYINDEKIGKYDLLYWQPGKEYQVGDVCQATNGPAWKRMECVVTGTSSAVEPNWPDAGQTITDGTCQWQVDDVRDALRTIVNVESTGYGIIEGLNVSAQNTPDMTIQVKGGVVHMPSGKRFVITAVTALAILAADLSLPREDLVYVTSGGIVAYAAGAPAETPIPPTTPIGSFALANIEVAANVTAITSDNIIDQRMFKMDTQSQIDPRIFGADKTGINYSTQAIINSLDSVNAIDYGSYGMKNGGGEIKLPPGVFKIDTNQLLLKDNIRIKGAGIGLTLLVVYGTGGTALQTTANENQNIFIEDLTILNGGDVDDGIYIKNCYKPTLRNVHTYGFKNNGITLHGCIASVIDNCYSYNNGNIGLYLQNLPGIAANNMFTIIGGAYRVNTTAGISIENGHLKGNILGPVIESNGYSTAGDGYGIKITGSTDSVYINAYFENNKCHIAIGDTTTVFGNPRDIKVDSSFFSTTNGGGPYAKIFGGKNIKFDNCSNHSLTAPAVIEVYKHADVIEFSDNMQGFWVLRGNGITYPLKPKTKQNLLPSTKAEAWNGINATIARDLTQVTPKAGLREVFEIAPVSGGVFGVNTVINIPGTVNKDYFTLGIFVKSKTLAQQRLYFSMSATFSYSSTILYPTNPDYDSFNAGKEWTWVKIGRMIPADVIDANPSGTRNLTISLYSTNYTDNFYISEPVIVKGMATEPPEFVPTNGTIVLNDSGGQYMSSDNGNLYKLTVSDVGTLTATAKIR